MTQHFIGQVTQRALIEKDGKILISADAHNPGFWELPGGRLNLAEQPKEGLEREIKEELGLVIEVSEPLYLAQYFRRENTDPCVYIAYRCRLRDIAPSFVFEPSEVLEVRWVSEKELENQKIYKHALAALKNHFNVLS